MLVIAVTSYYPLPEKEPSGCLQTLVITRAIFALLAVPVGLIAAAVFSIGFTMWLFTVNPLLAVIPLALGATGIYALARWEKARVAKLMPPPEE